MKPRSRFATLMFCVFLPFLFQETGARETSGEIVPACKSVKTVIETQADS